VRARGLRPRRATSHLAIAMRGVLPSAWCPESEVRWQHRATLARISSADFVQANGFGCSFVIAMQLSIAASRASVLRCTPRRIWRCVSSPNQRSTMLIQDELVGVKCRWKRGRFASQRRIVGALCVERLSSTRCTSSSLGTLASMVSRNSSVRVMTRSTSASAIVRGAPGQITTTPNCHQFTDSGHWGARLAQQRMAARSAKWSERPLDLARAASPLQTGMGSQIDLGMVAPASVPFLGLRRRTWTIPSAATRAAYGLRPTVAAESNPGISRREALEGSLGVRAFFMSFGYTSSSRTPGRRAGPIAPWRRVRGSAGRSRAGSRTSRPRTRTR